MRTEGALPHVGDKYRLLQPIGSGGMSVVYQAEHLLTGREVAIKLLLPERMGDRGLAARLMREARTLGRLRHPGVTEVIDAGACELGPYLVMELLRGTSLSEYLRGNKLSPDAAIGLTLAVLGVLEAAHKQGIVHRDLKPENVFLTLDGREQLLVKLLDFGIAKTDDPGSESEGRTSTGVILGTPDYLSPEQATGDPCVDARSDVFSTGVLLYELLTGERPFQAASAVATAYRIAHANPEPLSQRSFPRGTQLDQVLSCAMAKNRALRYSTARAFSQALGALLTDAEAAERELGGRLRRLAAEESSPDRMVRSGTGRSTPTGWSERPTRSASDSAQSRPGTALSRAETHSKPNAQGGAASARQTLDTPTLLSPRGGPKDSRAGGPSSDPAWLANREQANASSHEPRSSRPKSFDPGSQRQPSSGGGASAALSQASAAPSRKHSLAPGFPTHHARGAVVQAIDEHVRDQFAPWLRQRVLQRLDAAAREELEQNTLQSIVYYPIDIVSAYLSATTSELYGGNPGWCRTAGTNAVNHAFAPMLRSAIQPGSTAVVLRRLSTTCRSLFDFGVWQLDPENLELTIDGFEPAPMGLRLWLVGLLESSLKQVHPQTRIEVRRGEQSFSPRIVLRAHGPLR